MQTHMLNTLNDNTSVVHALNKEVKKTETMSHLSSIFTIMIHSGSHVVKKAVIL